MSTAPSLLLLRGPLHRLLDLLLLLLAWDGSHRALSRHGDHGDLRLEDHHGGLILHSSHFMAGDLLGAMAGGTAAVAGGALRAVAASVSTGAHLWSEQETWEEKSLVLRCTQALLCIQLSSVCVCVCPAGSTPLPTPLPHFRALLPHHHPTQCSPIILVSRSSRLHIPALPWCISQALMQDALQ